MLFKGSMITAASGKVGGLVASHNSGGQYLRQFAVPTDPNTALQQQRKSSFGLVSNRWNTVLTEAQRNAWNAIAGTITATNALGDPLQLNGQQAYVRAASIAHLAGLTLPDAAPTVTGETNLGTLALTTLDGATQAVQGTIDDEPDWAADADGRLLVFVGRGVSPGTRFYKGPFQFAGAEEGNAVPVTTFDVSIPAANFQLVIGLRYFIRFRAYLGGQLSQDEILSGIAV